MLGKIFLLWTLKEAYTKALGEGLGFDFSRIDYDFDQKRITINSEVPKGWEFRAFTLDHSDVCRYQCAIALRTTETAKETLVYASAPETRYLDVTTLINSFAR